MRERERDGPLYTTSLYTYTHTVLQSKAASLIYPPLFFFEFFSPSYSSSSRHHLSFTFKVPTPWNRSSDMKRIQKYILWGSVLWSIRFEFSSSLSPEANRLYRHIWIKKAGNHMHNAAFSFSIPNFQYTVYGYVHYQTTTVKSWLVSLLPAW